MQMKPAVNCVKNVAGDELRKSKGCDDEERRTTFPMKIKFLEMFIESRI